MGKLIIIFVVSLLVASGQRFSKGQLGPIAVPNPSNIPPPGGWQCGNECNMNRQEDCNPGCYCSRFWEGSMDGVCLWNEQPPP
ncbi:hypothetical protein Leryth_010445 [Lithospermum erythrorhizon]|nr:hypothetical protein Leryth_010445 [Lithospermum erythrorhizon]